VTTADEGTWPADGPVLFLGEWCRLYERRRVWERLDAEVVPYHWDDRDKLSRDYLYLRDLHEQLLAELTGALNQRHGVSHSIRYWRILVGPWLGYFTQMLFDRWYMLRAAVTAFSVRSVRVRCTPTAAVVPNDMNEFMAGAILRQSSSDMWNEHVYGQLIRHWTDIPVDDCEPAPGFETAGLSTQQAGFAGRIRQALSRAASRVAPMFARENDAFIMGTYLPLRADLRLQLQLGQVPKRWRTFPVPKARYDGNNRQWTIGNDSADGFERIVRSMIPRHLPMVYLEGYRSLLHACAAVPWPTSPRLIFTSGCDSSDDLFKAWAAAKVEAGSPLIIGQHGGNYATSRWSFTEDHQYAISDRWLSWGGYSDPDPKVRQVGNLKMAGRRLNHDPDGYILLVENMVPRYSYHMYSVPVAGQWLQYFDEQCRLAGALTEKLRSELVVRLYSPDYSWSAAQRWRDVFPGLRYDNGTRSIVSAIAGCRLCVSTSNTTTFLETLALNIPTIMFWNPLHWELRAEAVPYFEELQEVGVFHKSPESAASKIHEVSPNVDAWWGLRNVKKACDRFRNRFSAPLDPIPLLKGVLGEPIGARVTV
jgi:putative transferase (TIGR04331 family)